MYEMIDRYVVSLIERSTPESTVWNIERVRQGKPSDWNYIDGCMLTALISMSEITGDGQFFDFAERVVDHFVQDDGTIRTYHPEKRSLDDINEGRVLFPLYAKTGKQKYEKAARYLHGQLLGQPRTGEGSFWHKLIYPDQVWLDGIYMAQPFEALYQKHFGDGDYSDIMRQIRVVRDRMKDPDTGLYYHGYDASRKVFWADKTTGCSRSFWLRALGWYSVAMADLLEIMPEDAQRRELAGIFSRLMESLLRFSDPDTGMYWQVVDQIGREGNYLESSGSSMIAYAMLKGARLGVLPKEYAVQGHKTFDGIVRNRLSQADGQLSLSGICLVAGLGPEKDHRRDGSYEYYISEPVVSNDAKGAAPFLLCYTEIKRLPESP